MVEASPDPLSARGVACETIYTMQSTFCWPSVTVRRETSVIVSQKIVKAECTVNASLVLTLGLQGLRRK